MKRQSMIMRFSQALLIAIPLMLTVGSFAVTPPVGPAISESGDYTITFTHSGDISYLEERIGNAGAWVRISDASNNGVVPITNRATGTYQYRKLEITFSEGGGGPNPPYLPRSTKVLSLSEQGDIGRSDGHAPPPGLGLETPPGDPLLAAQSPMHNVTNTTSSAYHTTNGVVIERYSSAITVTVLNGPVPVVDEWDVQETYGYQVRLGDVNSDGRQDLHVQRIVGGDPDNGVLYETILQQNPDKTFYVRNASSANLSVGRSWPLIAVDVAVSDMNYDFHADILIENLDAYVPGVEDQLVFSSASFFERAAQEVVPFNDQRRQFYMDLYDGIFDENHFDNAVLPATPGYRVQIVVEAGFCFYPFGYPICSSEVYVAWEEEFALAELGLTSVIDTPAEQQTARAAIASKVTQDTNGEYNYGDFSCYLYCGYFVEYGFDFSAYVLWQDVWTFTILDAGSFDAVNFSEPAYNVAQLIRSTYGVGEQAISAQEVNTIRSAFINMLGGTVAVPVPVPAPTPVPDVNVGPAKRLLGVLGAVLSMLDLADYANRVVRRYKPIYHYTDSIGATAIQSSQTIINPEIPVGGPVWFTQLAYPSAAVADKLLAICGPSRTGYFILRLNDVIGLGDSTPVEPTICGPDTVQAGVTQPGGGWEQTAPSPQLLGTGAPFIPLLP